ncbi:c-type cytochrome [Duganella sp. FT92W]|uniref:C-type cytochrome n=1 Tax=Pseudoduganella rivuli TaxID=2666085 RepID=A0A7X2LTP1_9BURK|nr:cytochrome c [Pseudoduganella rivuli]MRV72182.1 c-type cytochrome [Pseudoduganella rivuli]
MNRRLAIACAVFAILLAGLWLIAPGDDPMPPPGKATAALSAPDRIARGAYLARAGDCQACHTTRGGQPYAGGRALQTPFGNVFAPNITSDRETGIGAWSADEFWRALHNGKSRDGRLLYPAFPYTNYTNVSRDDADALYAYFQTVPAVKQASLPHEVRFPYNLQASLWVWRSLYFRPAVYREDTGQSAQWNRGAYLVQGLGHCNACHSTRNVLGASSDRMSGGLITMLGWYAPSLTSDGEAGLGDWDTAHLAQLLKTGVSPRATVFGPMAEVVRESLQHLSDDDVQAMAMYLKTLPHAGGKAKPYERMESPEAQAFINLGSEVYLKHCVQCHGFGGKGLPPAYPPLNGNRALLMEEAANPIRIVLNGGFAPATAGNPRPYGMPPFAHVLSDTEVAAVVSYIRAAWNNNAPPINGNDVDRYRRVPLD